VSYILNISKAETLIIKASRVMESSKDGKHYRAKGGHDQMVFKKKGNFPRPTTEEGFTGTPDTWFDGMNSQSLKLY
jgi:hypothetical protein